MEHELKTCFIVDEPYRHDLSSAILELQENGKLSKLRLKWWSEKHGGGRCVVSDKIFKIYF